jgi:hypothetical protein
MGRLAELTSEAKAGSMVYKPLVHQTSSMDFDLEVRTFQSRDAMKAFLRNRLGAGWKALVRDLVGKNLVAHPSYERESPDARKHEAGKNPSVEDGFFIVQGYYDGGRVIHEASYESKREALREAVRLMREPWFEGDRVRVITRDGELVRATKHESGGNPRTSRTSGASRTAYSVPRRYPDAQEKEVARMHGEEVDPYPYPDAREAAVARMYGKKAQGGGWPGRTRNAPRASGAGLKARIGKLVGKKRK